VLIRRASVHTDAAVPSSGEWLDSHPFVQCVSVIELGLIIFFPAESKHMNDLPIEAHICEINDGPYYPVKLHSVPRVGELIDLWSFLNQTAGHEPAKWYEVVQVVHKIFDVTDKVPRSETGSQFVSLFVKPTASKYFQ